MPLKDKEKRKAYQAAWAKKNEIKLSERRAKWDKDNPGRHKATAADWYIKNKELTKERSKAHRIKNIEHVKIIKKIYQTKNKEHIRRHSLEWREANKERLKISKAAYHAANKHEISKRGGIWRGLHQEELRDARRKYRQSNPEKIRIINNNREAKKRGNGGKLSPGIIPKLLAHQKNKCAICRENLKKVGFHLDHIVPISRGGKNSDANVQITCPKCNLKKRDSDPIAFMQSMGYLL